MKTITEKEIAAVRLFNIQVSEDELAVFLDSLNYLLNHCDDALLDRVCGATRDEVEGMRDDIAMSLDRSLVESQEPTTSQKAPRLAERSHEKPRVAAVREPPETYQAE
jgi:hypothetical protein